MSSNISKTISSLLLQCGDIERNPGPFPKVFFGRNYFPWKIQFKTTALGQNPVKEKLVSKDYSVLADFQPGRPSGRAARLGGGAGGKNQVFAQKNLKFRRENAPNLIFQQQQ